MKKTALILVIIMILSLISCTNMPISQTPTTEETQVREFVTFKDAMQLLENAFEKTKSCPKFKCDLNCEGLGYDDRRHIEAYEKKSLNALDPGTENLRFTATSLESEITPKSTTEDSQSIYYENGAIFYLTDPSSVYMVMEDDYEINIYKDVEKYAFYNEMIKPIRKIPGNYGNAEIITDAKDGSKQINIHIGTNDFIAIMGDLNYRKETDLIFDFNETKEMKFTITLMLNSEGLPMNYSLSLSRLYVNINNSESDEEYTEQVNIQIDFDYENVKIEIPEECVDYIKEHTPEG